MINAIWLVGSSFVFSKHAHILQREIKRSLTQPVNTAFTDIIGKSRSHIINSVYCSDLLEFNWMTFVEGGKAAADHFQHLLTKYLEKFQVIIYYSLKLPTIFIFHIMNVVWIRLIHSTIICNMFVSNFTALIHMSLTVEWFKFRNKQGMSNTYLNRSKLLCEIPGI